MNTACARCGRPEAEPPNKYCDHCAHQVAKEYDRIQPLIIESMAKMIHLCQKRNKELESGNALAAGLTPAPDVINKEP